MKKDSDKNLKAKVLLMKVDKIAMDCGFYKGIGNLKNLSSNYRDSILPILVSFYATTGTIGISYCKEAFKWFKGCELKKIEDICELLTPKGMSFGDTNTSSLFLLLPIIAF